MDVDRLRKVALLIANLDRDSADRLLSELPSDRAQCVRDAVLALDGMDEDESREVIREFLDETHLTEGQVLGTANQEAVEAAERHAATVFERRASGSADTSTKDLIDRAPERVIAECLRDELPQAIAMALTQLPTQRASEVVSHLPAEQQAEVLERMVELDAAASREFVGVREQFQGWLHHQIERTMHRSDMAARLATILDATHSGARQRILHNVSHTDAGLAKELQHQLASTSR